MALEDELRAIRAREVQALGAALSLRNWHSTESAYNQLRDKLDRILHTPKFVTIPARDGVEAQHGLNDVFPGDPVKVPAALTERKAPVEVEGLVERLRQPDRWDAHYYSQGFGSGRNIDAPFKAADTLLSQATELATLKQQLAEREEAGWLPIATAPKDELVPVLLFNGQVTAGCWWEGLWTDFGQDCMLPQPSHWRPLPDAPALTDKGPEQKDGEQQ